MVVVNQSAKSALVVRRQSSLLAGEQTPLQNQSIRVSVGALAGGQVAFGVLFGAAPSCGPRRQEQSLTVMGPNRQATIDVVLGCVEVVALDGLLGGAQLLLGP